MADNPNAFKHWFNEAAVQRIAAVVTEEYPPFDSDGFVSALWPAIDAEELKARVEAVARALVGRLPDDVPAALSVLVRCLGEPWPASGEPFPKGVEGKGYGGPGLRGMTVWPLTRFVELRGLHHPAESLAALREMTRRFSGEFAVRPFLDADPEATLPVLQEWAQSTDQHVRRLASEGSRPRLPWGMRLKGFVADPHPLIPLLEALNDDPEEYVRRSVANNLNDIAKDHPDLVVDVCARWQAGGSPRTARIVKHATRTLVKQGHTGALRLLGFTVPPQVDAGSLRLASSRVTIGDVLRFEIDLRSTSETPQRWAVDYVVHHRKARGGTSPKVFKGKARHVAPGQRVEMARNHSFKVVPTRRYYPGPHAVEVVVNGQSVGRAEFELEAPAD